MHHAELGLGAVEVKLQNLLIHGVATLVGNASNGTFGTRWKEDLVFAEKTVLEDGAKDVASSDVVSDLELARCEVPFLLTIEGGQVDTTGDVDAVRVIGDTLEGSLDTVINGLHQTWAKLDGKRLTGSEDGVADS